MKQRDLSPEFKKEFVVRIGGAKGKDAVLYNGLLALAHEDDRFGHIRAYITQYPSAENKFVAFARAEIYDKKGNVVGMEESDASAANCGKMTAASFPRMACTRAKGRALRDFLNVGMVTADEIPEVYEPDLASPKKIGKIKQLAKKNKLKKDELYDLIYEETGSDSMNDLTEMEANQIIKVLQNMDEKEEEFDLTEDE